MVDRFSLFRIWGWNPQLGAELASFSRKYMILGCVAVFAVISSFVFAQFPYDNVCDPPDPVTGVAGQYLGVRDANGEVINQGTGSDGIAVVFQDTSVQFCEQSRGRSDEFWFPATKRVQKGGLTWFGDEQVKAFLDFGVCLCEVPSFSSPFVRCIHQANITAVYGWTSVLIVSVLVIYLFGRSAFDLARSIFTGVYQVRRKKTKPENG